MFLTDDGSYLVSNLCKRLSPDPGDMQGYVYDPLHVSADVFDRQNHYGYQHIESIYGLSDELEMLGVFTPPIATPAIRTIPEKLWDRPDIRDWAGIDLTGNNDNSAEVQSAVNKTASEGATLNLFTGQIAIDATIFVPAYSKMIGPSLPQYQAAWFHITHSGIGFSASGQYGAQTFRGFGTYRTQPTPSGSTFTPADHDFDFSFGSTSDVVMEDIMLFNPTLGIHVFADPAIGGGGRFTMRNIRGQPLRRGLKVDAAYDVVRVSDVHWWPYWSRNTIVKSYQQSNLITFESLRNDNPIYSNIFSIWQFIGFYIDYFPGDGVGSPAGTTQNMRIVSADFDGGQYAIRAAAAADGFSATAFGLSSHGRGTLTSGPPIQLDCDNAVLRLIAPRFTNLSGSAIRVNGTGNTVVADNPHVDVWNGDGAGWNAMYCGAGNTLAVPGYPIFKNGMAGATPYGGAGTIRVNSFVAPT